MQLNGKKLDFTPKTRHFSPYWLLVWIIMVAAGVRLIIGVRQGDVKPLFQPTFTPTRATNSYAQEAEAHFLAGNLEESINSYKEATRLDPDDPELWSELARIQTYSSNLLPTDAEKRTRLQDALFSIDQAKKLSPDDSTVRAIRSFVLDWNSNPLLNPEKNQQFLTEAEQEAVAAIQLDSSNALGLAYYAEILIDQMKFQQAEEYLQQAMERDTNLMDVHRIQGYYYENISAYNPAILEYEKASEINPNLTFLYIQRGKIFRHLQLYDQALELFEKAARLNEQLGINDPIPYLAIANTYAQMGEFFSAARNVKKALLLDPTGPDVYGQLGVIYHKSRNYEGAVPAFECAILGCSPEKSCEVRQCDSATDAQITITGMPLSDSTVVYYYTYGSVLSGLHRPGDTYCQQAMDILEEIKAKYASDTTIMSIVKSGEDICAGE
jgi:tetratricopeptide (TPR) repeat protein